MKPTLPLAALLLLAPAALPAGLAGWEPRDGPRVILYEKAGFRGEAIELRPGQTLENLDRFTFGNGRRANDRISSIRVEGGAEVYVFVDSHYRGDAMRVAHDLPNLADIPGRWNDRISSVRVEFSHGGRPGPDRPPAPAPRPGDRIDPEKVIRLAYQDVLEREPDPAGLRHYRSLMIERGWTEQQVRADLRRSEEYRGPVMTNRLNRIYQELLGRDVDPRGFDHYRNKIIEHGWNDDDIRRDIRGGAEYRQRTRV